MRIGVDLGGTKIEALALADDGRELLRERVPTPAGDYEATVAAIASLVAFLEGKLGERGSVGVGHPGSLSPTTGRIRNANSTALNGRALDRDLAEALGREVALANDANCFAISEATDGAAAGLETVFGVILGTGVGGGLVVGGRCLYGQNGIAGEWGHNPLPKARDEERPGPPCACGRLGCIEAFLSGPALARDHRAHGRRRTRASAREIVEAAFAPTPDPSCLASLERYAERLARALASIINVFDPHAIVLGGGMSNCAWLYRRVPELWTPHVFSDAVTTPLLPPKYGDSSGVRGAAWLA